jgi:hypothetical protein
MDNKSRDYREGVLLAFILVLAVVVRLWNIDFGLPNEHVRPDERHLIGFTLTIGGNKLNPGFFNYPSLYLYSLFMAYGAYFAIGRLTGHFSSAQDLVNEYALAPSALYLIDRVLVALLGTATVFLAYFIGKRIANARVGLMAALLLALSYLHVRESHFGTVDVPLGFMTTLALAFILNAARTDSLKSHLWAGLVCGLAVSTKYNAIVLLAPLALLHAPLFGHQLAWKRALTVLGAASFMVVLGFLAGTPFAVLDHQAFLRDTSYELFDKLSKPASPDYGPGWIYSLRVTLPLGLGVPLLLLSVVGVAAQLRARQRAAVLMLSFAVAYWLVMGKAHLGFVRYSVPLVSTLAVFAALGIDALARYASGRLDRGAPSSRRPVYGATCAVLIVVALAIPTYRLVRWNTLLGEVDTRVLAGEWIHGNVAPGTDVGLVGSQYMRPELLSTLEQMRRASPETQKQGRSLRTSILMQHVERDHPPTYETYFFDGAWRDAMDPEHVAERAPRYVVVPEHPLVGALGSVVPVLGPEYALAARFDGCSPCSDDAVFDWWDAFFLPISGFAGTVRGGPNLRIYARLP